MAKIFGRNIPRFILGENNLTGRNCPCLLRQGRMFVNWRGEEVNNSENTRVDEFLFTGIDGKSFV